MTGPNQSVESLDALLDFSEYDAVSTYQSPSLSPAAAGKTPFARPVSAVTTPTITTTSQPLSGPSHQYDLYKQQTGIVPGALASTLAVNQSNSQISGYNYELDYSLNNLSPENDLFDFNTAPSQTSLNLSEMDMDFDSPSDEPSFFIDSTVNPTNIAGQESPSMTSQSSNMGRVWPGMHSQAALAKAQAQQRQQQQIIQQQRQQQQQQAKPRSKSGQPSDPIVEQKITQLLNSMRAKPVHPGQQDPSEMLHISRPKKDEDDMDEDERLLASEEGKKLSSKERRQLRNKVSARAFRSRRKEYITQLESEIANKVSENGDLRTQNRALMEENKRLSDLTRMLLSSSSFSGFLDHLSTNPSALPQQSQPQIKTEQQQQRRAPKDVNPYAANQQLDQQQIGMAMIPEHTMDFSMLSLDSDAFNFQPQVFAVLETPEVPTTLDVGVLSGKTSNFVGESFDSEDEKVELPTICHPVEAKTSAPAAPVTAPVDEEFEADPAFALYHSESSEPAAPVELDIFGGVESEKVLARYELVDASQEEQSAVLALERVQRISAGLESVMSRLEQMTLEL